MVENKLIIKNINYKLDSKIILDSINFTVKKGEFLSILGPSGCGKTTLLRILIGLTKADQGTIVKDDTDISNFHSSQRGMGIVFQNYAYFENMSVLENVAYALKRKSDRTIDHYKVSKEMLEQVGMLEHINKRPTELSGGQQQRVAIARTLVLNPEIILFDEPMSALDVDTRLELRQELKDIQNKYNTTMLYITHDQEEAFAMSDRIMVMSTSKIEQIGTPFELIESPSNEYVQHFVVDNLKTKIDSIIRFVR